MTNPAPQALAEFAVVIVSFGSSKLLRRNAAALELPSSGRIVVVDCYSSAAERERVRAIAGQHGWTAVLLDDNAGFGGGTNAGAERAIELGAQVIVALNPDAQIDRESLEVLVAAVQEDPMLVASPMIVEVDGSPWFSGADLYLEDGSVRGARARQRFEGIERRAWATGACFSISLELWRKLAGFDEEYFLYWEDIDLSHRALNAGGRLAIAEATVVHDAGGTQTAIGAGRAKSETYYYYNIRNRLLYAVKHLPGGDVKRWERSAARVGYGVLLRGGRRQLVTSVQPWRAYLRALRDGRRLVREHRRGVRARPSKGEARSAR